MTNAETGSAELIVTSIDQRTLEVIIYSEKESGLLRRKSAAIDSVLKIIYQGRQEEIGKLDPEERTILSYVIEEASRRHKDDKRSALGLPYINHPISVARLLQSQGEDIYTICGGLLHDTIENYVESVVKREYKREFLRRVEELEEKKSREMYNRTQKRLTLIQMRAVKKAITEDVERLRKEVEEQLREREKTLRETYRLELVLQLGEVLKKREITPEKIAKFTENMDQILNGLTRSYFGNYYEAIDEIVSPTPNISPKNKVRAIKIKFADCIVNTDLVDDSLYSLEELMKAINPLRNEDQIAKFESMTEIGMAVHRKEKEDRIRGHKRVYRTFKNYFLVNSFRSYKRYMEISNRLSTFVEGNVLSRMVEAGLCEAMKEMSQIFIQEKRISESRKQRAISMISALAGEIEAYKEEQNRSWIPSFVEDCARTRFVKHVDSYSDVVSVIRNYMREKEEYVKHKEALERYEKMLVKRSYRSAGLIIDHLVSYHSSRTQLPFDRIAKMVDINERYKMDDGYRYVTVPSHIKVELGPETPEGAAGVEVIVTNGTRKTLATPDGIIMLFIDTRVKGDDKRLLELYQNKANMLWAALSSRTLGEMYLAEPNFILYGIDSEGIHPSAAIARK